MKIQNNFYTFLFSLFAIIFLLHFASAQGISSAIDDAVMRMEQPLRLLFGDVSGGNGISPGELIFIKFLVFIMLFAVISMILKIIPNFRDNKTISMLIAFIVALLSVRYMTTAQIVSFIWLPYGTLGIVFSVILPFIIGFYFIESFDSSLIRKVGWSAYVVIFAGLAYMRWDTMQTGAWWQNLAWMYLAIAILSFFLLLFDKQIRLYMFMSSLRGVDDINKRAEAAKLTKKIEEDYAILNGLTDPSARKAVLKRIEGYKRAIKDIMRS